ncbi:hypothetical protein V1358_08065 [Pseudoalteromonas sp. YIC-656]|uniref:hypothetical protein n=1 Tax=Pseudoalteromonas pernae TaxID=3118054 RepID=UPI00324220CC
MFKFLKNEKKPLFFVHIPKTAGTSFRQALSSKRMLHLDYGKESPVTTNAIKKYIYKNDDFYALKSDITESKGSIAGHCHLAKYQDFVESSHIVSFVRSPSSQIISHYNHHAKFNDFSGTFEDFLMSPSYHSIQSKLLKGLPLTLLGVIGVTERYSESLKLFKAFYGDNLSEHQSNRNTSPKVRSEQIDVNLHKRLTNRGRADQALYDAAVEMLDEKLLFLENCSPQQWVYSHVKLLDNGHLFGCAFYHGEGSGVVDLELEVAGDLKRLKANRYFGAFPKANFPRGRYIGFLSDPINKNDYDNLTLRVAGTNQVIFDSKKVNSHG